MQEIQVDEQNNRKIYIEAMRIFAILFVIFNHTNIVGFVHFIKHEPASALFWFANAICIAICCMATYIKGMEQGKFTENDSQSFFSTLAFVNCITIYLTIKKLFSRIQLKNTGNGL